MVTHLERMGSMKEKGKSARIDSPLRKSSFGCRIQRQTDRRTDSVALYIVKPDGWKIQVCLSIYLVLNSSS